jgi:recombination protein RecA
MSESTENEQLSKAERAKNLDAAMLQIEKQYGKGAIMRLDQDNIIAHPALSTGALSLDLALGIGGVPKGRIVEIYGPESSGKTTLTLEIIAQAQKNGGMAAFIDAEHALDPGYAKRLGVNIDELLVAQPDNGEQALEIAEALVRSNALDVVVIDSVAALVPKSEIEGDMGQATMGVQARLMSQALRKLTGAIHKTNTVVIFINQIRMKIGVCSDHLRPRPAGMPSSMQRSDGHPQSRNRWGKNQCEPRSGQSGKEQDGPESRVRYLQ